MRALGLALCAVLSACHSPGQYGYSRVYSPLDDEADAVSSAKEYDPVMVQRSPDEWKGKSVTLFGVVKSRGTGPGGSADLTLGLRILEKRNLCEDRDEASCRVTVSDREHALVHALIQLTDEDDIGKNSVAVGSLLRIVGSISDSVDPHDGAPVIRTSYYRHWPRNYYVTTASREHMRQ